MRVCCEGGPMTAGCYHDHCTGPRELAISGVGGEHDSERFPEFIKATKTVKQIEVSDA